MTVYVLPSESPRIVRVPISDGTEITAQELIDQLRTFEERPDSQSFPLMIKAEGKGDLGSGVLIGITATLQDAQVEFEERITPTSSGTVTSGGGATTLNDTAATFIADGVVRGSWVVNFTDQSVSTVKTVDSGIKLTTTTLVEGTGNTYDTSDVYKVWNIIQVEVSGGNLIAVDDVGADLSSVYTSFGTQVVRTASVSATLQEQADIEYSSFQNGVWIDVSTSNTGIIFPTGTPRQAVNNIVDATTIANARGFKRFYVVKDLTVGATDNVDDFELVGEDPNKSKVTLTAGASTELSEFINCELTGDISGTVSITECIMNNVDNIGSTAKETIIKRSRFITDTYSLSTAATKNVILEYCTSGAVGHGGPTFDFAGATVSLVIRHWTGGIKFGNITGGQDNSIDMDAGHITVNATCTSGKLVVHGVTMFNDNSTGAFVFDSSGIVNEDTITDQVWARTLEGTLTAQQIMRLLLAGDAGDVDIVSGTVTIKNQDGLKTRITATTTAEGKRTVTAIDVT